MEYLPFNQPYRPQIHLSAPNGWLNDPNGLVFHAGEYHAFYQHHPFSDIWGPMHWGHAVSKDLIEWTHLPIALAPDELGMIFSGSALIDKNNTAGFGANAMILIYTYFLDGRQWQALAYSLDNGRSFTKYANNPILTPPDGVQDFRDPKVIWFGDDQSGHWVMSLAAGKQIMFYTSANLLDWQPSGSFGETHGSLEGVWETPDLFQLPIEGQNAASWVLTVGVGAGGPAGGSGTQYFIGDFDGKTFTNHNHEHLILWMDHGSDFYAPQSWSGEPNGQRISVGWMNNWAYAVDLPTQGFRGSFTLPRQLRLVETSAGIRLAQTPLGVPPMAKNAQTKRDQIVLSPSSPTVKLDAVELPVRIGFSLDLTGKGKENFKFSLLDEQGGQLVIELDAKDRELIIDRSASGHNELNQNYFPIARAPIPIGWRQVSFDIIIDTASVEVFLNEGRLSLTVLFFPAMGALTPTLALGGGGIELVVRELQIERLDSYRHNALV